MNRVLFLLPALLLLALPGFPQEPAPGEQATPEDRLVEAIEKLEGKPFAVRGTVGRETQEVGPSGGTIVFHQAAGGAPPYDGAFEAWTDGKGTFLAASESALPGFECYRSRGKRIDRLTFRAEKFDVDELMNDVPALTDMGNLRRFVRQARLRVRAEEATGATTFSGELSPELVPAGSGGVMGIMRPKVLRVEATLVLEPVRGLVSAEFRVIRSDPVASLMGGGGIRLGGGGGLVGPNGRPLPEREGAACTYAFDLRNREPGPRTVGFLETVNRLEREGK